MKKILVCILLFGVDYVILKKKGFVLNLLFFIFLISSIIYFLNKSLICSEKILYINLIILYLNNLRYLRFLKKLQNYKTSIYFQFFLVFILGLIICDI